jgi:hypothetical protein
LAEQNLIALAKPYTLTGDLRIAAMIDALHEIDDKAISGDVVECGVWRGGNIVLARKICPDRICWLYDTFAGMTEPTEYDVSRKGRLAVDKWKTHRDNWCAASIGEVESVLQETGTFDASKLRFVVGDVCESLHYPEHIPENIALLRLDTDWYFSTKLELEILYPKLASGGVLIVDDYGHWNGARKAVDEYFNGSVSFVEIDYTAIKIVKP